MSRSNWKGFYIGFFQIDFITVFDFWKTNFVGDYFDFDFEGEDYDDNCSARRNVYLLKEFLNCYLTTSSGYEDIPLLISLGHLGYNISSFINTKQLFVTHMKNKKNKIIQKKQNKSYSNKIKEKLANSKKKKMGSGKIVKKKK